MSSLEEQKLIEKCQAGDLAAFGGLYDLYAEKIYRYIYYRARHKETAQDLTSQTFFKAMESIKSFDFKKGVFSAWLYRIARNVFIDNYRAKRNEVAIDKIWDLRSEDNLEKSSEIKDQILRAKQYLAGLSQDQQEIVILRVWDGLSHREIAEILGKTEGNCKVTFSRAIGKLRKGEVLALLALGIIINQIIS